MYCENCGINTANFHLLKIINGTKTEYNLCGDCAAKLGYTLDLRPAGMNATGMNALGGINIPAAIFPELTTPKSVELPKTCHCKMSFQDFHKNGLLGCPVCYTTFEQELSEFIKRLQGANEHVGRRPDDDPTKVELTILRQKLKQAVDNEDYETAAKLRDEIKTKE